MLDKHYRSFYRSDCCKDEFILHNIRIIIIKKKRHKVFIVRMAKNLGGRGEELTDNTGTRGNTVLSGDTRKYFSFPEINTDKKEKPF